MLCFALPAVLQGQARSQSEANALCSAGTDALLTEKTQLAYVELSALRKQREQNQSKIAIGMSREEVLQLLGRPHTAYGTWLDSAQTFCIWTYTHLPRTDGSGIVHYGSLEVISDLNHRVGGVQFREELSLKPPAFRGDVK